LSGGCIGCAAEAGVAFGVADLWFRFRFAAFADEAAVGPLVVAIADLALGSGIVRAPHEVGGEVPAFAADSFRL
jgi:hypothetical protein